jgi:site-specific DNA-methyltransferase (adenine-specific)
MPLYNEDCLKVMADFRDDFFDLVVTDCPYHIVSGGCTNDAVKIGRNPQPSGIFEKHKANDDAQDQDSIAYTRQGKLFKHNEIKFSEWLPEVYRVLKPNSHCYIMINPRNCKDLQIEAEKAGFIFQNLIVWDKGNTLPNRYYLNSYELILMLRKGKAKNINNKGTKNILRVPNIIRNKQHPTEKPVELMQILIENSSEPFDYVLDPFMGVGGVGVACMRSDRLFYGIEIDKKYFDVAESRIKQELVNHIENL